jgi:hypothetical protein
VFKLLLTWNVCARIPVSGLVWANLHCVHAALTVSNVACFDTLVRVHVCFPVHCPPTLAINTQLIHASHLSPPPSSTNILHLVRHYACNATYQYGQDTATIHSKNIMWFHYIFSESTVQADHCYHTFQKHQFTFVIFFSKTIFLGILWVRNKNSEWLMQENDTTRKMYLIYLYIIYVGDVQGPEKMNDTCRKTMQRRTMDRSFTVHILVQQEWKWRLLCYSRTTCKSIFAENHVLCILNVKLLWETVQHDRVITSAKFKVTSQHLPALLLDISGATREHWWMNLEWLELTWGCTIEHKMAAGYGTLCTIQSCNSNL